jgi:sec-independent protein translocase protein TatC
MPKINNLDGFYSEKQIQNNQIEVHQEPIQKPFIENMKEKEEVNKKNTIINKPEISSEIKFESISVSQTDVKLQSQKIDIEALEKDKITDSSISNLNEKSIIDHLFDIKNIILASGGIWLLFTILSSFFLNSIQNLLFAPAKSLGLVLNFLSPIEGLMFTLKLSALSGLVLSIPFITLIIWKYIHQELKFKEKKAIVSFSLASSLLTVVAILYSWFGLIPNALKFLVDFTPEGTQILLTVSEYFNFIFSLTLALIVIFQIPTLIYTLVKTKIVSANQVSQKRKEIYIGIVIATALFGSPDFFSWFLTTIPAIFLFEVALFLTKFGGEN